MSNDKLMIYYWRLMIDGFVKSGFFIFYEFIVIILFIKLIKRLSTNQQSSIYNQQLIIFQQKNNISAEIGSKLSV